MSGQVHALASPWYPLHRRLGGPQSRCGCCGEKKNFLPLPGIKPQFLNHPAHSPVTELSRFPNLKQWFCGILLLQSLSNRWFSHNLSSFDNYEHLYHTQFPTKYKINLRITCTLNKGCNAKL
jgi:hypothetical protein